jgi:hypothetical protein
MDTDEKQLHSSVFILFIGGSIVFFLRVLACSAVAKRFFFAAFASSRLILPSRIEDRFALAS